MPHKEPDESKKKKTRSKVGKKENRQGYGTDGEHRLFQTKKIVNSNEQERRREKKG